MDKETRQRIIDLAEKNGLDPEEILALDSADGLPEDLRLTIEAVMGDVATFGQALTKLDTEKAS